MAEFAQNSVFFGAFLTFLAYGIGTIIYKKTKISILNANVVSIALIIIVLLLIDVDYETYNVSAKYISYLLTPVTVCLAVPLYEQYERLKENMAAVLLGITAGVLASLVSVLVLCLLFHLDYASYVTLLPKSITTAIAIGVTEELGGYVALTVTVLMITGNLGNAFAEVACKIMRIKEPVAIGVGIGTSSHAMGTSKALEMGEVEGAMSGLAIGIAGLLTVVGASIFAQVPFF